MTKDKQRNHLEARKTPTQSRSAETVNVILEAAARILEETGFEGYTTNAVAERAGVSIGSLYQYFPGKDALTVALIERETSVLLAEIAIAQQAQSCAAGLDRVIHAAVAHQMRRPTLARLLDFEERRLPIDTRTGRVTDLIHAALLALFSLEDSPVLKHADIVSYDVIAIVKGIVDAAGERAETDPQRLNLRVRRAVFGYLGASAGEP